MMIRMKNGKIIQSNHKQIMENNNLMFAVMNGDTEQVKQLLEAGALVDETNAEGRTPLMAAVYQNHVPIAEVLIQHGADLYAIDKSSYSVLYYAAVHGKFESTYLLVESGIKIQLDNQQIKEIVSIAKEKNLLHIVELIEAAANL